MSKVRRLQIIERMQRGATLRKGLYGTYMLYGGSSWPKGSREEILYISDCHKGDVERMVKKGELIVTYPYPQMHAEYRLASTGGVKA